MHSVLRPSLRPFLHFPQLGLSDAILRSLKDEGYTIPTPIQAQAIAPDSGRPRRARVRANRHGQDRGVRAADPASARW